VIATQLLKHGAQSGELLRQDGERPVLLAGVMPAQRRAKRQPVRQQRPWPLAVAAEIEIDVLTESSQLLTEADVDFD
jgi:hypothetical protein